MLFVPQFAITDPILEEGEVLFLVILAAVFVGAISYVRRLKSELQRQKRMLEEQSELNEKLNSTVDRILQIEKEGGIDSNRRKKS